MLLLQSVRKYFEVFGIYSPRSNPYNSKWNWRIVAFFISLSQLAVSSIAFSIFQAKTAAESGYSFCQALNGTAAMAINSVYLWKCEEIFKLLEQFEEFISKSEFEFALVLLLIKYEFITPNRISNRNARIAAFESYVLRIEWLDWTTDQTIPFDYSENFDAVIYSTAADHKYDQILHLRFGCRSIWTASADYVMIKRSKIIMKTLFS